MLFKWENQKRHTFRIHCTLSGSPLCVDLKDERQDITVLQDSYEAVFYWVRLLISLAQNYLAWLAWSIQSPKLFQSTYLLNLSECKACLPPLNSDPSAPGVVSISVFQGHHNRIPPEEELCHRWEGNYIIPSAFFSYLLHHYERNTPVRHR